MEEEIEIQIIWTDRAKADLHKVYEFNCDVMPEPKAWGIVVQLSDFTEKNLKERIDVGMPDFQFAHLGYDYKKLIEPPYKITYRIEGTVKYVLRVFDQRQHPDKNL